MEHAGTQIICWVSLSLNSRNYCKEHSPLHRGLCSESTTSDSFLEEEEGRDSGDDEDDDNMSAKERQVNDDIWCAGQVDENLQKFDSARPTMTNDQIKSMWRTRRDVKRKANDDFYHRQHQAGHPESSRKGDLSLSSTQCGNDSKSEPKLKDVRNPDVVKIVSLNKSATQRAVNHWSANNTNVLPPSQNSSSQNSSKNRPRSSLKEWVNDYKRKALPQGEDHLERSIEELRILLKKSENEYPPSDDDAKFRRQFCQVKDMYDLDEIYLQRRLGMVQEIDANKATEPIPKRVMEAIQNYIKATHSKEAPDQRDIDIVRQYENQEDITFRTKQKQVYINYQHNRLQSIALLRHR